MNFELLFEKRKTIGENILNVLRDNGYTKSSFAKLIDITRPTLDKLLLGEIDSLTKFKNYIDRIIGTHLIDEEQLLNYVQVIKATNEPVFIYSFNAPNGHKINQQAIEMFSMLDDVLHLCEIYYK